MRLIALLAGIVYTSACAAQGQPSIQNHVPRSLTQVELDQHIIKSDMGGSIVHARHIYPYGHRDRWGLARVEASVKYFVSQENQVINFQELFHQLIFRDEGKRAEAFALIEEHWNDHFSAPLIEIFRLADDPALTRATTRLLEEKTGLNYGNDYFAWLQWLWAKPADLPSFYGDLKGQLYRYIDPKFERYFAGRQTDAAIRLDEVVWGGVKQDGIPPLRSPNMIPVAEASYLDDSDVVFGLDLNGEARAYPKRILAWHEFFVDRFGEQHIAGVYCTLCGTVIAYDMTHDGVFHDLGTSGFLYRSNKLMYDRATQSLWNTIEGEPVVGPLVGQGIRLAVHPVVTTTWGAWKAAHPDTQVLSLRTGHQRDYGEGVAYQSYFATDDLMFPVPTRDDRLLNKDEVMVVRAEGYANDPLAMSIQFLRRKPLYRDKVGATSFVVLTEKKGGSRAYQVDGQTFKSYKNGKLTDQSGTVWAVTESHLVHPNGEKLARLPSHNIFWFAWLNMFPQTRLVR